MMRELSIAQTEDDPIGAALKDPQVQVRLWNAARAALQRRGRELSPIQRTEEAKVIVQEASLRAWQRRSQFDGSRDAVNWLVGFVSNVAREFVKNYAREVTGTPSDGPGLEVLAVDPSRTVDDIIADKLLAEHLVGHLAEPDRQIVLMKICEGNTCAEIGQQIGMRECAVRVRIFRAMLKLKKICGLAREGQP